MAAKKPIEKPKPSRQSAYDKRRLENGWRRVPVWLSPECIVALERLRDVHGSDQEAIRQAILTLAG